MGAFQKVANRVALGVILAASIIGAAIMMSVQTPRFTLFGYPGLAIILFLIAVIGGLLLVIVILLNDERTRRKTKGPNPG